MGKYESYSHVVLNLCCSTSYIILDFKKEELKQLESGNLKDFKCSCKYQPTREIAIHT
jgi:hypothetical protein